MLSGCAFTLHYFHPVILAAVEVCWGTAEIWVLCLRAFQTNLISRLAKWQLQTRTAISCDKCVYPHKDSQIEQGQDNLTCHPILPYIKYILPIFSAGTWNRWNPCWVPQVPQVPQLRSTAQGSASTSELRGNCPQLCWNGLHLQNHWIFGIYKTVGNVISLLSYFRYKKNAGSHLPHIFTSFTSSSYDPPMLSPRNQLLGWSSILVDHRWLNQVHIPILIRLHPAKLSQQFHPIPINNHHGWKPYPTHKLLGDIPITSQLYTTLSHDK